MSNHTNDAIDAYADRVSRMAVLIRFLNTEIVHFQNGEYDPLIVSAVSFLHEEVFKCRAEQDQFADAAREASDA